MIDLNIHLGDVMVTGALTVIGFGMRRFYALVASKMDEHTHVVEDVDEHAEVINLHTLVLNKDGHSFPILERRKRARRAQPSDLN